MVGARRGSRSGARPAPGALSLPERLAGADRLTRVTAHQLELTVDPADAARFGRLALLKTNGAPAPRGVAAEIVWHDTADGALEREARIVASERGRWRLERLRPQPVDAWPPATTAPVIAEAQSIDGLADALPASLVARAAFRGRKRIWSVGGLSVELWQGALHGLTVERPVCRLRIGGAAGPDEAGGAGAGAALAQRIAETIPLAPPRMSLAEEALATAAGRDCRANRLGTIAVPAGASVDAALARIAGHLAEVMIWWAGLIPARASPEAVHQMRVATRRLRSGLRLFRRAAGAETLAPFNAALRDLARCLGAARDWDVFLDGTGRQVSALLPDEPGLGAMMAAAARRRTEAYDAVQAHLVSADGRRLLLALALLPALRPWRLDADEERLAALDAPFEDYAAAALDRLWKRLGAAGDDLAALPVEALHDLRKDAKRLRYTAEFCGLLLSGKAARRLLDRLEALQEALGHINDGHVAADLMRRLGGGADRRFAAGAVRGYVAAHGEGAMEAAETAWRKLRKLDLFWK